MSLEYISGATLPQPGFVWNDPAVGLIDFSSGWTFEIRIGNPGQAAVVTKTTGITGAATSPNVAVAWDPTELDGLAVNTYTVNVIATFTATGNRRIGETTVQINAGVLAAA